MKKEDLTILKAETIVTRTESSFLHWLMAEFRYLQGQPTERGKILKEILTEKKRLDPKRHCADEEEVIIYDMERNERTDE